MDIEKLIERLKKSADFEDYPVVASFAAIIEKKYLRDAATALSTLQAENEKLQAELYNLRPGFQNQKALIKQLRTELEQVREKNAGLALALLTECAPNPDCLGDDEWRAIRAELEQVKQDRIGWLSPICIGCPGKTEDGKRTELCGEPDDLSLCVEQSKRLAELARAALRREQDGNRI